MNIKTMYQLNQSENEGECYEDNASGEAVIDGLKTQHSNTVVKKLCKPVFFNLSIL